MLTLKGRIPIPPLALNLNPVLSQFSERVVEEQV